MSDLPLRHRLQLWALALGLPCQPGASLFLSHVFRVDLTRLVDPGGWAVGVSLARFDFASDHLIQATVVTGSQRVLGCPRRSFGPP
ncbi:MAG TPA: hypothetical protein QF604_11165 [Candidatus Latescibacteria bacterium]|nr:hypothetical protein [Candidatus Latescibacterota bacterium]